MGFTEQELEYVKKYFTEILESEENADVEYRNMLDDEDLGNMRLFIDCPELMADQVLSSTVWEVLGLWVWCEHEIEEVRECINDDMFIQVLEKYRNEED